jgi:putative Mn2+ efflux pump MntP
MPLLGWFGGAHVAFLFHGHESWLLFGSLAFVGGCMLRSAQAPDDARLKMMSLPGTVLSLALATSVDSMAIGLALAMVRVNILQVSAVIGTCAACLSFTGLLLGGLLGQTMGKWSKFAGGFALVMLGLRAFIH